MNGMPPISADEWKGIYNMWKMNRFEMLADSVNAVKPIFIESEGGARAIDFRITLQNDETTMLLSLEAVENTEDVSLLRACIKEDRKDAVRFKGDEAEKLAGLFGIEKAVIDWIAFR